MRDSLQATARSWQVIFCAVAVLWVGGSIMSTASGQNLPHRRLRRDVRVVSITPKWKAVVTSVTKNGKTQVIELLDLKSGASRVLLRYSVRTDHFGSIAISPDETLFALKAFGKTTGAFRAFGKSGNAAADGPGFDDLSAQVRHVKTGRLKWISSRGRRREDQNGVGSLTFSPDGGTLASLGVAIRLWDVKTGRLKRQLSTTSRFDVGYSCAFSPDGKTLATGNANRTVRLWDLRTGRTVFVLHAHKGKLDPRASRESPNYFYVNDNYVTFSPNGKMLASVSQFDHTIWLWNIRSGKLIRTLPCGDCPGYPSLAFSPDSKILAINSERHLRR